MWCTGRGWCSTHTLPGASLALRAPPKGQRFSVVPCTCPNRGKFLCPSVWKGRPLQTRVGSSQQHRMFAQAFHRTSVRHHQEPPGQTGLPLQTKEWMLPAGCVNRQGLTRVCNTVGYLHPFVWKGRPLQIRARGSWQRCVVVQVFFCSRKHATLLGASRQ